MAPYRPVYLTRSDGKLEILSKSRKKESNAPTADQLDSRSDAKGNTDYFKELELGDAKEVDWRRKLGGMLIREVGGQEHPGTSSMQCCWLSARWLMPARQQLHLSRSTRELQAL